MDVIHCATHLSLVVQKCSFSILNQEIDESANRLVADANGGGWFWDATTGGDPINNLAYLNRIQPQESARRPT